MKKKMKTKRKMEMRKGEWIVESVKEKIGGNVK